MKKERYNVGKISVGAQRKNDVATLRKNSLCAAKGNKRRRFEGFWHKKSGVLRSIEMIDFSI